MSKSRRIVIQFIVTAREKRTIQAKAKRIGVSVSQFIRNATCSNAQHDSSWTFTGRHRV